MKKLKETDQQWFQNDHIPMNILSRLPAKTLIGLKLVSKEWKELILDPIFIQLHLKRKEPVSGFFFQERFQYCEDDIRKISYISAERKGADVPQSALDFLPEDVVIAATSNGLVCCRSCLPSPQPVLYICNPLNRQWIKMPWLAPDRKDSIGFAFDPSWDPIDSATKFKVVRVFQGENDNVENEEFQYLFDIYSSETKEWRRSNEICRCGNNLYKSKGIVAGGIFYWLTDGDHIIMFDLENDLCWLIMVPLPSSQLSSYSDKCIGESEGGLHYVLISEYGLMLWVLEDQFSSHWELKYTITLTELEEVYPEFLCNLPERATSQLMPWLDPLAFKDGFLITRVSIGIYIYHFGTREMKLLCPLSSLGRICIYSPIVLPYAMSLVRLGQAEE